MADIFLSYANEDRTVAEAVARGLEASGLSVWYDRNIHGGADFSAQIDRELSSARAAVVLWSRASVASEWVRDEAGEARDAGKLIPARIDDSRPPLGFRQRQAIDLTRWGGKASDPAFAELVSSVFNIIGQAPQAPAVERKPAAAVGGRRRRAVLLAAACAALITVAAAALTLRAGVQPAGVAVAPVRPLNEASGVFSEGLSAALLREFAEAGIDASANRKRPEFRFKSAVGMEGEKFVVDLGAEDAKGRVLWSQRLRQDEMEVGAFQDFAASRGAGTMTCSLNKRAKAAGKLTTAQFGHLLAVCAAWGSDNGAARYAAATQLVRAAPDLALAQAELAAAAGPMAMAAQSASERMKYRAQSAEAARAALAIDPEFGLAHTVLGHAYRTEGDLVRAMEHWEKGLEFSLDEPGPYMTMEWQLKEFGRVDASIDVNQRAMGRFPDDPYFHFGLADAYSMKGWHDDMADAFERARAVDPESKVRSAGFVEWTSLMFGAHEEAAQALAALKAANDIPADDACFQTFLDARIAKSAGAPIDDRIALMKTRCDSRFWQSRLYAILGDADAAIESLQLFYDTPEWHTRTILFGPEMHLLHGDPRFWDLASQLGLVEYWLSSGHWPDFCSDRQVPVDCQALAQAATARSGDMPVQSP